MAPRDLQLDGRTLRIYDDGAPDGPVILHHHGTPAAGGPMAIWARDAHERGARLICYDRPGYGESTPAPGRTVATAAQDAAAIMDALEVERFATWGISGGGPHALACAARLPERVVAVASLGGVAPFDASGLNYFLGMGEDNLIEFGLTLAGREHIEPYCAHAASDLLTATPAGIAEAMASLVSAPDLEVLHDGFGRHLVATMSTTFAHGAGGWVDDDLAFVAPFGFEFEAISVPALVVHGRQDRFVPVAHGEWLADAIPGAQAWIWDEDGHLTLVANRVPAVHEWLLGRF
jgi:pimeloyl-ACP methyl ester carboxylesterase